MFEYIKTVSHCMKKVSEENPEDSKNWSPDELLEKAADWAGRHVLLTNEEEDDE